ncbi:hypothetical protein SLEP1_g15392 [Rubroshorea leprosula]|uniref:Integrase catalytic domain-containing protein n=1 Tax=Rubroshorea leprosula TaxID=152421 RepID=A0AAV5IWF1_9ROSI|nr:hypothetical protein SLEP1_g15392 [Rubroshorea leprosula]
MQAQNASDALMCKIFPSTLRGNARTWYYSLPPRSVSSYTELASAFATKFSSRRLIRKTTSELMRVRQRDRESLKNFMSRFNDAVLEVNSFDQAVGITAVISGLGHERFRDSLLKHPATTFSEVNDRSLKFITAEEYAMSQHLTPIKSQHPDLRDENPNRKRMKTTQNRGPMSTSTPRFGRPNSAPPQQPTGKPPDHGHTTEQCNSLRSELESLAQKGMLNEYIQRVEQPRFVREQGPQHQAIRNPPNRQGVGYQQAPPPLPPPARVIHMITGGLEAGGLSSKQRKLYVREVRHQNRAQKRKFDDAEWKNQPITFTSADLETVVTPHNDPLVTSVTVNNCEVQRVLVDTGSAPNIMYFHYFESLGIDPALLQRYDGPIYGFNNQPVPVEGVLTMNVAFGSGRSYVTPSVRFLVVKMASSFNAFIGRPTLTEIRAVVSQSHLCVKFPTPTGIATLRGNQEVARHCYITSITQPQKSKAQTPEINPKQILDDRQVMGVEIVDNRPEDETRAAPVEDVEEVQIDDRDPSRKTQIRTKLHPEERAELIAFLRANNDVFAWTSADMPGIPTSVFQHKLNTNPLKKPVGQKRRLFGGERLKVIKEEVEKLLQAGFVRRVDYCEWVAKPVLVKKANGKWRMCIDYTNLNNACPKDCYLMPNIDKLVEAASGNERLKELTTLVAPWPFAQWGLDLLGPFIKGVGGVTHLIVGVDYFTKYGIPNQIVADNGTQFNCTSFRDFCSSYGIKLQFTSVYHPKSNGMVESVNKCILEGIKPRLEQHKAKWADELNNGLWAYRTTSRTATGETPYHLAFGTEAVIPIEIGVPSFRVTHFDERRNGQLLRENLDLLDDLREEARLRTLVYKQKIANFYNKRVRPRSFKVGDLVLRKAGLTGFETRFGKLAPNWEGPYTVAEVPHPGAYILRDTDGKRVPRVWNVNNLKKFYP